ncbi:hypothetical protein CASFOL_016167 [Castilleja foliolosa]|uniref:GH10 domain-containing protein n=1 Tax=Castilleja foliolosa TaxID=1961234 RepID=A0ABD3DJK6_9LAMI
MMKLINSNHMIYIAILLIICGLQAHGVPYDDTISVDCLATPLSAQYNGGMVMNAELDEGLNGWTAFGDAKIAHVLSDNGNKFVAAYERNNTTHSISQTFHLEEDTIYTFSAWVQVTDEEAHVGAVFKTNTGDEFAARGLARRGCWTMMKGGLVAKTSGPTQLYFETESRGDVWVDSISLQSFSQQEWNDHQQQRIQKFDFAVITDGFRDGHDCHEPRQQMFVRQQMLRIQAVSPNGLPIANAIVSLKQTHRRFPVGCAINKDIINNRKYQKWFLKRFKYATFENELKWYSTEIKPGVEDYSIPDAMMRFARENKIGIRGHNGLWEDPTYQNYWVTRLSQRDLWTAANRRITSMVSRYKGKFIHLDVMNENLHSNFFESRLNYKQASSYFYKLAHKLDNKATPFLNDFNTIEDASDPSSSPHMYKKKVDEMRAQGCGRRLGLGLEGHFIHDKVNLAYIRASIEYLSQMKLPIWVTELDVTSGRHQAKYLGQIMDELHSQKYVRGIVFWASMDQNGNCYKMCLTDRNYKNLPTGNVVDKFIHDLTHKGKFDSPATTDSNGFFEASVYHGDYEVQVMYPSRNLSNTRKIKVTPKRKSEHETASHTHRFTFDVEN